MNASQEITWVKKDVIARRYGYSRRYIELLMRRHILPYRKTGRRCVRFNPEACDAALEKFDVKSSLI